MPIDPGAIPQGALIVGLAADKFQFLMGLAGIVSGLVVITIWSRGL